jgi:hypothetical protein
VTQNAYRRRAERKMLSLDERNADPSRGHDTPELLVKDERDVAIKSGKTLKEPISTIGHLRGRFASGATVAKDIPVRAPLADVRRTFAFVIAVIPLRQVRFHDRRGPQSSRQGPRLRACSSPLSVSGISERPVCWPERDHSVFPCRTRMSREAMLSPVPLCRTRWVAPFPIPYLVQVLAVLVDIDFVFDQLVADHLLQVVALAA